MGLSFERKWWAELDSNQRRQSQQIYSLFLDCFLMFVYECSCATKPSKQKGKMPVPLVAQENPKVHR